MSIAEKLTTIAENQQRVYEAGQKSVGALREVVGNPVRLDYVNPTEHTIAVRLKNGKNLFDISRVKGYGSKLANNGDGTLTVTTNDKTSGVGLDEAGQPLRYFAPGLEAGKTYTLSATTTGTEDKIYLSGPKVTWRFGKSVVMTEEMLEAAVNLYASGLSTSAVISNIQIEEGEVATEYVPHITDFSGIVLTSSGMDAAGNTYEGATYTAGADGTVEGVKSLAPTTVLATDAVGVQIAAQYYVAADYEWHRFWDAYQQNGARRNYNRAFAGEGWTNEIFKPKYDMIGIGSFQDMFRNTALTGDLTELLGDVVWDSSPVGEMQNVFTNAKGLTRIGVIGLQACKGNTVAMFQGCTALVTIDRLVVNENNTYKNMFVNCTALANVTIEGVIANDIDLSACPLTRASILSVLDHLCTLSTTKVVTFKQTAVETAFGAAEWDERVGEADGRKWTVALL